MSGMPGAVLATIGVFLPSFVFVALLNPLVPRMRKSPLWVMCCYLFDVQFDVFANITGLGK
jgi:hypothetical protein